MFIPDVPWLFITFSVLWESCEIADITAELKDAEVILLLFYHYGSTWHWRQRGRSISFNKEAVEWPNTLLKVKINKTLFNQERIIASLNLRAIQVFQPTFATGA